MKLIAGGSNVALAKEISRLLDVPLTRTKIGRFSDGEVEVEIEEHIRGGDVFVIQSTSPPVNENLMELLVLLDGLKRSSSSRITAIIPYFGYSRQDRRSATRTPISAKLVADLLATAGADRVMTLDLHAPQIEGFFDIPVDNMIAGSLFVDEIKERFGKSMDLLTVVSPDVGGVARARGLAKRIGAELAIIDKRREKPGSSQVMNVIGEVKDRICLMIDDIVDSAGTLCNAADALAKEGAKSVAAYATHGVLSGPAVERINASSLESLTITDSIAPTKASADAAKIKRLSIAPLLAEAIARVHQERSLSSLFT